MYSKLDDMIALTGIIFFIAGIYLWLGLPAALIVFGAILIYIGARIDTASLRSKHNGPN